MSCKRLLLVDGMAGVYRAFYAIRDLSTRDGRPTNAIFGFIRMVRQLREHWAPTHWGVVFDGGLPEQRTQLLETYKAQRPSMPDPLRQQLDGVNTYLDAAGIWTLRVDGQEADDVMAALVRQADPEMDEVLLATNDKDMYQIVNDRVTLVGLAGKGARMGPAEVRAISFPGGRVDLARCEVRYDDGGHAELSERELELLRYLAAHAGRAISREEILTRVWGLDPRGITTRTIDMHIARLREKLRDDPAHPRTIRTVRGKGYLFADPDAAT